VFVKINRYGELRVADPKTKLCELVGNFCLLAPYKQLREEWKRRGRGLWYSDSYLQKFLNDYNKSNPVRNLTSIEKKTDGTEFIFDGFPDFKVQLDATGEVMTFPPIEVKSNATGSHMIFS